MILGGNSPIIIGFLRVYIFLGFIIAVLLNVYIIRILQKIVQLLETRRIHEDHNLGDHRSGSDSVAERVRDPAAEGRKAD